MNQVWKINQPNLRLQEKFCKNLGVTELAAQILINRGILDLESAHFFLFGNLSSCHDPFLLKDMEKSVLRIHQAISNSEKILIYGDYDVDGVTSLAVLSNTLRALGADFQTYIPNRVDDGYGMNVRAVDFAKELGVKLIITVDCGINSIHEVECANNYGIDVIITDHHEIRGQKLPDAYAIIDPHRTDCGYPFKYLAGVGIAYKLSKALCKDNEFNPDQTLDLVALGTVADVSPMIDENRVLVREGLKIIQNQTRLGMKALIKSAKIRADKITCRHLGFILGPRINAMGRIGSANQALDLLMCNDITYANELAAILEKENKRRQEIEKSLLEKVIPLAEAQIKGTDKKSIVLAGDDWHQGVLGIVASRISNKYSCPAILVSFDNETGKGSGRSVAGVDLFQCIKQTGDHLINFGGHELACGIKIEKKCFNIFREQFDEAVKNDLVSKHVTETVMRIDMSVPFANIGLKLAEEMHLFMPYGEGNPEPVFLANNITVKSQPRVFDRGGYKFFASCGNRVCEAITFSDKKFIKPKKGEVVDLVFTPSINKWDGINTVQLNIKDIRLSDV